MNDLTIIDANLPAIVQPGASPREMTIEAIIGGWLQSKFQRSESDKTIKNYQIIITRFRDYLLSENKDLIYESEHYVEEIVDYAQLFCSQRFNESHHQGNLSKAAKANRIATLSSFYKYCIQQGHLNTINPIQRVTRPIVESYSSAHFIRENIVASALEEVDQDSDIGMRDIALLHVLFNTGRRVTEIQRLRRRDIEVREDGSMNISFTTKGNKKQRGVLHKLAARTLTRWLLHYYQVNRLSAIPNDAPIWIDLQHATHKQLEYQGIRGTIQRYFTNSDGAPLGKVHMTRHTFAILALKSGANLVEIQHLLGHKSAATTAIYLEMLPDQENKYADTIAAMIGIKE